MIPQIICWISLPEIGYIVGIAAVSYTHLTLPTKA